MPVAVQILSASVFKVVQMLVTLPCGTFYCTRHQFRYDYDYFILLVLSIIEYAQFQVIRYHQAYSVAEILSRQCMSYKSNSEQCSTAGAPGSLMDDDPVSPSGSSTSSSTTSAYSSNCLAQLRLSLKVFDHPFPYGLNLKLDVVKQVQTFLHQTFYYLLSRWLKFKLWI